MSKIGKLPATYEKRFKSQYQMLQYLNSVVRTKQKYVSVSRPRRFGKTMAADMICAYYDREANSRELFEKRKLPGCPAVITGDRKIRWDEYLGQFDVIRIVMTDFMNDSDSADDMISNLTDEVTEELMESYAGMYKLWKPNKTFNSH